MPHLIIEFARDLAEDGEIPALLDAVHNAALSTGLFQEEHIRTRAVPVIHYCTGTGRAPFMHAQLRIHSGRSTDDKHALSTAVLAALRAAHWPVASITVEVVDMDRDTYAKHVAG